MAGNQKYRYPGPQEFEDTPTDSRRFFGRSIEISTVAERIIASRLLVVYGGSGLGKSSLLKAGVFPKLRAENLLPIRVRLNKPGGSVLELLKDACAETARSASKEFGIDYTSGQGQTAWEFFRTVMFWRGERLVQPVLVFDQFEEIFTLAEAGWRKEFGREIGPLASANAPATIRERLRSGERGLSDQAPNVKVVFCLREEYYGSLQELSPHFPGLFHDRFRLRALDSQQAELAIVEPARLQKEESSTENFATPPFEYERAGIDSMLEFLQDRSENIEPVPLQLLCQYVEQVVLEGKRKAGTAPYVMTAGDLGGKKAMNEVIGRFYEDSINSLPASQRHHARELCDTGLLAATGNRLLLEKSQIVKDYKVDDATLRYLTDERRILRQEPRLESTFYEISHDTIARSIVESRRWRLPKQWRRAAAVSVVFMIALGAFAVWALVERSNAVHAKVAKQELAEEASASAHREKAAAEQARNSLTRAEGMVAFLMGEDFLAKLRPMGRLSVFEDVQKAVPCKQMEEAVEYSDVGLKNLGLACLNEGDIYYGQFRLREANERYEKARLHFAELARRKGGRDENLAEALFKRAQVAEDQLDLGISLDLMRQSLAMQEQLVADGTSDDKLLRDRANSYLHIGNVREKQGYLREALSNFEHAVALGGQRDSVEWLYVRQDALLGESEVFAKQGNSKRSEASAKEAYDCAKKAVEKSAFAPEAKYRLGVAISKLPNRDQKAEDRLREYQEVFDDVDSAAKWDPENKTWARDRAATHILLGEELGNLNRWDDAAEHYRTAIPIAEELLKLDPTNRQLSLDLLVWVHKSMGEAYDKQSASVHEQFLAAMKPGGVADERGSGAREAAPPSLEPKVVSVKSATKSKDALNEFLEAQERLQQLQAYAPGDMEVRYSLVNTALWLAYLQGTNDQVHEAMETCERAFRDLGPIRDPTDSLYWHYKQQLETDLAERLKAEGHRAKADETFRAAAADIERLEAHFPPELETWNAKFDLYYYHIAPFRQSGKDPAGEWSAYEQAFEAIKAAVRLQPRDDELQSKLAFVQQQMGDSLRNSGQLAEAQEHYASAEEAWQLVLQLEESAKYENRLFLLFYDHIAELRKQQKDEVGTRKAYQDSLEHITKAAKLGPKEPVYQNNLALVQQQIGDSFRDSGELAQAQEHYASAEKSWQYALQLEESAEYQNRLFLLFYDHIAELRKKEKDDDGSRKAYQDSLQHIAKATTLDPKEPVYRANLSDALERIGDTLGDNGDSVGAERAYKQSEQSLRAALELKPDSTNYHNKLYLLLRDHVGPQYGNDKSAALKIYQESAKEAEKTIALAPDKGVYRANLGRANLSVGNVLRDQDRLNEAEETYKAALESTQQAIALDPKNPSHREALGAIYFNGLVALRQKRGDRPAMLQCYRRALEAVEQASALDPKTAVYYYDIALTHKSIAELDERDKEWAAAKDEYKNALRAIATAVELASAESKYSEERAEIEKKIKHLDIQ